MTTNRSRALVVVVSALLLVVGCAGGHTQPSAGPTNTRPSDPTVSPSTPPSPTASSTPPTRAPKSPVTIAFAGDVHFASFLADRLRHPKTAMGPLAAVLAHADLSIVNLETAVTTRGTPQPKQYTFRAPPSVFTALRDAGIDIVTMANNHALDYGPVSVPDALAAAKAADFPVIGIGEDATAAYRPWIFTVHGQRIAFLAATAVVDADLIASWSAGPTQPGVATALDGDNARLVAAVQAVRPHVDTVIVDLHYGSDLMTCPTSIQQTLASDLTAAGADIVVGQHAHVLLGGGYLGSTYVDYGLGNFEFYASSGELGAQTGVLTLTVDGSKVSQPTWTPGRVVAGLPTRLTGSAATQGQASWNALRQCAGLTVKPDPHS